mgnify:FL=1
MYKRQINNSRSLTASINTNLLLRASNIDTFIEQPDLVKRKMIVETRETVDKLLIRNGNLTRENEALKSENKSIKSEILKMTDKVAVLKKTQDKLIKQVTYLMKTTDEAKRKEILSQMGIEDGFVDLNIYSENLQQELLEVMDINKSLRKYLSGGDEIQSIEKKQISIKDDIMSGLDF